MGSPLTMQAMDCAGSGETPPASTASATAQPAAGTKQDEVGGKELDGGHGHVSRINQFVPRCAGYISGTVRASRY